MLAASAGGGQRCAVPVSELRAAVEKAPADAAAWLRLGRSLAAIEEPLEALDAFGRASELRPSDPAIGREYALALAAAGMGKPAAAALDSVLRATPDDVPASAALAYVWTLSGDPDKGLKQARSILARHRDSAPGHYQAGLALQQKEDLEGARREFAAALKADPGFAAAAYMAGLAAWRSGDSGPAIENLRRAVALAPDAAEAHILLGSILRREGDLAAARGFFERGIELDSGNPAAVNGLAQVLRMTGDIEASRKLMADAAHFQRHRDAARAAMFHINAAREQVRESKYATAESVLRQALAIDPDSACAHRNLGRVLAAMGKPQAAAQELKRADELETGLCARKAVTRFPMLQMQSSMAP